MVLFPPAMSTFTRGLSFQTGSTFLESTYRCTELKSKLLKGGYTQVIKGSFIGGFQGMPGVQIISHIESMTKM